jgi:hypothetical protein
MTFNANQNNLSRFAANNRARLRRCANHGTSEKNEIQITWLGHAAFELLSSGGTDILIGSIPDEKSCDTSGVQGSVALSPELYSRHTLTWRSSGRRRGAGEDEQSENRERLRAGAVQEGRVRARTYRAGQCRR